MSVRRIGATLVELLAVLAIIAILSALALIAVQASRESARKITCANNLRQLSLAVQNYASANRVFPPGGGGGFSFHVRLLPFIGEQNRYNQVNFQKRGEDQLNEEWAKVPRIITCPTDPFTQMSLNRNATNYIGVSGGGAGANYNGTIVAVIPERGYPMVSAAAVTDGLSHTLVATEAAAYFEFSDGEESPHGRAITYKTGRAYSMPEEILQFKKECFEGMGLVKTARGLGCYWTEPSTGITKFDCIFPKQPRNCANYGSKVNALFAPSSLHSGGVYCALADGSVRFTNQSIDEELWQALGTRNGGEITNSRPTD